MFTNESKAAELITDSHLRRRGSIAQHEEILPSKEISFLFETSALTQMDRSSTLTFPLYP